MGLAFNTYLRGERIYGCSHCKSHLAVSEDILSKSFTGSHGTAYLFNKVVNVKEGEISERNMRTGIYTVKDISCARCSQYVGWRYVRAYSETESYKEGKYILETSQFIHVK